jgi:hypothetical protein
MAFSVKSISQRSEERNVGRICEINPDAHLEVSKAYFSLVIFHLSFSILISHKLSFVVVEQRTLSQIAPAQMENEK